MKKTVENRIWKIVVEVRGWRLDKFLSSTFYLQNTILYPLSSIVKRNMYICYFIFKI